MRSHSSNLVDVLRSGSFDVEWVADVYYDGARQLSNLPIRSPSIDEDGSALVQGTGSCTVEWSSDFATSLMPRLAGDTLAPFGSELSIAVLISAGSFVERVQMGWYRIDDVPNASDQFVDFGNGILPVGSTVELALQDRFRKVQRDLIDVPGAPPSRNSVLTEAQRISGLQIVREIPDTVIPKTFAYEEERLDPLYDLIEFANGVPYMRPDGTLGQRSIDWGTTVDTVSAGQDGTLVSLGYAMSSDQVYNRVAFRSTANGDEAQQILAVAEITDGPLRVRNADGSPSPYGRVTYYAESDQVTTRAQAKAYVDKLLPQVSALRIAERPMVEVFNPLRQVGDVLLVDPIGEPPFRARVSKISRDDGPTQQTTLEVQ
jgi:hypothetical protein